MRQVLENCESVRWCAAMSPTREMFLGYAHQVFHRARRGAGFRLDPAAETAYRLDIAGGGDQQVLVFAARPFRHELQVEQVVVGKDVPGRQRRRQVILEAHVAERMQLAVQPQHVFLLAEIPGLQVEADVQAVGRSPAPFGIARQQAVRIVEAGDAAIQRESFIAHAYFTGERHAGRFLGGVHRAVHNRPDRQEQRGSLASLEFGLKLELFALHAELVHAAGRIALGRRLVVDPVAETMEAAGAARPVADPGAQARYAVLRKTGDLLALLAVEDIGESSVGPADVDNRDAAQQPRRRQRHILPALVMEAPPQLAAGVRRSQGRPVDDAGLAGITSHARLAVGSDDIGRSRGQGHGDHGKRHRIAKAAGPPAPGLRWIVMLGWLVGRLDGTVSPGG
ncbi:hypothetical protein CFU_4219 [Collimonas fungivorans Ter331]|uniref:Uncharacterized protein n=1 Tax=Collimonas fungivorans (strain Ter331) TaxID=1005048 RepID=G0AEB0_COLFT|nr:hypothetical protein CFU_4219 [Collimonas fungivorans Ter331]